MINGKEAKHLPYMNFETIRNCRVLQCCSAETRISNFGVIVDEFLLQEFGVVTTMYIRTNRGISLFSKWESRVLISSRDHPNLVSISEKISVINGNLLLLFKAGQANVQKRQHFCQK